MSSQDKAKKIGRMAWHQVERARAFLDRRWRRWLLEGDRLEREAGHWSRRKQGEIVTWQDHPVIRAHINFRVSGDPVVNWLEDFGRRFGGGFDLALNLGCGFGDLEAHAFGLGLVREFHSLDLSATALAAAGKKLQGLPVRFEQCDLNQVVLPAGAYDVVFAASSLHHLLRLEHVLDQVRSGLRPGGLLVFDEYVGPSRFQWEETQLRAVNELLSALPGRYRRDLRGGGKKRRIYRPAQDETNRDSPFEAIRSAEILPLVRERFTVVAERGYGGAILHPLLDGIAGNFQLERAEDVDLLTRLAGLEERLEEAGVIRSDFTVMVARKG